MPAFKNAKDSNRRGEDGVPRDLGNDRAINSSSSEGKRFIHQVRNVGQDGPTAGGNSSGSGEPGKRLD